MGIKIRTIIFVLGFLVTGFQAIGMDNKDQTKSEELGNSICTLRNTPINQGFLDDMADAIKNDSPGQPSIIDVSKAIDELTKLHKGLQSTTHNAASSNLQTETDTPVLKAIWNLLSYFKIMDVDKKEKGVSPLKIQDVTTDAIGGTPTLTQTVASASILPETPSGEGKTADNSSFYHWANPFGYLPSFSLWGNASSTPVILEEKTSAESTENTGPSITPVSETNTPSPETSKDNLSPTGAASKGEINEEKV